MQMWLPSKFILSNLFLFLEKSVTTDMVIVSDSDIPLESEDIIIENIHDDKICDYNNHDLHSSNVKTAQNVIYQPQKKGM